MKPTLLFICACLSSLQADELDPRLAPLAATYLKQIDEIKVRSAVDEKKALEIFLDEIKSTEDKLMKSGDTKTLAVITKERTQILSGIILPVPDVGLPKLLQAQHRTFYKAHEEVEAAIAKQKKQLDIKYLAALVRLQPAEGTDQALAGQIAEQKNRVISGNFGPINNLQTQIGGTRWQSVRDPNHFEFFAPNGRYSSWKYTTPDPETVVVHWDDHSSISWKLAKDGKTLLMGGVPDLKLVPAVK